LFASVESQTGQTQSISDRDVLFKLANNTRLNYSFAKEDLKPVQQIINGTKFNSSINPIKTKFNKSMIILNVSSKYFINKSDLLKNASSPTTIVDPKGKNKIGILNIIKFLDSNENNKKDPGEVGIADFSFIIREKYGIFNKTIISERKGIQIELAPGLYIVTESKKVGYKNTTPYEQPTTISDNATSILYFGSRLDSTPLMHEKVKSSNETQPKLKLITPQENTMLNNSGIEDNRTDLWENLTDLLVKINRTDLWENITYKINRTDYLPGNQIEASTENFAADSEEGAGLNRPRADASVENFAPDSEEGPFTIEPSQVTSNENEILLEDDTYVLPAGGEVGGTGGHHKKISSKSSEPKENTTKSPSIPKMAKADLEMALDWIAFYYEKNMFLNHEYTVKASIEPEKGASLDKFWVPASPEYMEINATPGLKYKLSLVGNGFEVSLNKNVEAEQIFNSEIPSIWIWQVTPKLEGEQNLTLTAYCVVSGCKATMIEDWPVTVIIKKKQIPDYFNDIKRFGIANFQWIIGTLIIGTGFGAWILRKAKSIKK
jgi:hypothetical protein